MKHLKEYCAQHLRFFNDPYDCEFCFQLEAIINTIERQRCIESLQKVLRLSRKEKNIIRSSKSIESALRKVFEAHNMHFAPEWLNGFSEIGIVVPNCNVVRPDVLELPTTEDVLNVKNNIAAFYLGSKISDAHKNEIVQFGKTNTIPVYQMVLSSNSYELKAQQVV